MADSTKHSDGSEPVATMPITVSKRQTVTNDVWVSGPLDEEAIYLATREYRKHYYHSANVLAMHPDLRYKFFAEIEKTYDLPELNQYRGLTIQPDPELMKGEWCVRRSEEQTWVIGSLERHLDADDAGNDLELSDKEPI